MLDDEITKLYYSADPLCVEGRVFLADRQLSILQAIKSGVCSRNGLIYFMYSINGQIIRWKARSMSDKKHQFMSKVKPEDESTFKMPFFSHFKDPSCDYIIITEGEFDCIALLQLGASNCVSLPNGCGSVETTFRNHYEFLQQFDKIYIAFDMDKCGEEAAKKALSLISPTKFRRICFPAKDANDWIKENPEVELKDLHALMANARKVENNSIANMGELPKSYYDAVDLGISTGWKKLDDILGGVRIGEVTVLSAETGAGKSTFSINFFKNLADQGHGIWINSYEMDPKITARKFASLILQKRMKFQPFTQEDINKYQDYMRKHRCYINVDNKNVDLDILRNQFEMISLVYGVKYILIDHLDYIHSNGKKNTVLENIDDAVRGIHSLAMEFKVGVILVVHPQQLKEGQEVTMANLKGSSAIKQYADNIVIVTRMDRNDPEDKKRVKVRVFKNRLNGKEAQIFLRYLPEQDGYTESF